MKPSKLSSWRWRCGLWWWVQASQDDSGHDNDDDGADYNDAGGDDVDVDGDGDDDGGDDVDDDGDGDGGDDVDDGDEDNNSDDDNDCSTHGSCGGVKNDYSDSALVNLVDAGFLITFGHMPCSD